MPIACDIQRFTLLSDEERELFQNAKRVQDILLNAKTIAIVGMSTESTKPSNMVGSYLLDEGYTVIPVNPRATEILGQKCYPDLKSIPVPVDVVDVFRPAREIPAIVEEAIAINAKAVWTQLKLVDVEASRKAHDAGLVSIADHCIKMEHGRYSGRLHMAGMNTGVVTAQRRKAR